MSDHIPPPSPSPTTPALDQGGGSQPAIRRWGWLVAAIVGAKLAVVAGALLLPAGAAVALGAAHVSVALVVLMAVALGVVLYRHRVRWHHPGFRRGGRR